MKQLAVIRVLTALLLTSSLLLSAASCTSKRETGEESSTLTETLPETTSPDDEEEPSGSMQGFLCVAGPLDGAEKKTVRSGEDALTLVADYAKTHGYRNAWKYLSLSSVRSVGDTTYYRLAQNYNDRPVIDRGFVLAVDGEGRVLALTGNAVDTRGIPKEPVLTADEAASNALDALGGAKEIYDVTMPVTGAPYLALLADEGTQKYVLCWVVTLYVDASPLRVLVDAENGSMIRTDSLLFTDTAPMSGKDMDGADVTFTGTVTEGGYLLSDPTAGITVYDAGNKPVNAVVGAGENGVPALIVTAGDKPITPVTAKTPDGADAFAVTALSRVRAAQELFASLFGLARFDGADGDVSVVINDKYDGVFGNNAWASVAGNRAVISLGAEGLLNPSSKKNLAFDVVGHEYTHAVVQSVAGLLGSGESGTIAEAYADLFGEFIQDFADDGELNNSCDWIHGYPAQYNKYEVSRSIVDPGATGNPVFLGQDSITEEQAAAYGFDESEIHHRSTVVSYAALSTMSETLTPARLAELWFRALHLLPADASFTELRRALEVTASVMGLSDEEKQAQSVAFDRACIYGYAYGESLDVQVFDRFGRPYSAYAATVTQSGEEVVTVTGSEPTFHLDLRPGNYTLTLSDTLAEDHVKTMILRVGDGSVPTSPLLHLYFLADTRSSLESILDERTVEGELPSVAEMTAPVGIRALDGTLPLPAELVLLSTGSTSDGRTWRRYGFVETDMVVSKVVRTILYIAPGEGIGESVYLLFSRADGTPIGGQYDEIYRKCALVKKLTGWALTYTGGTIPTLVENASNSGSKFSYTASESNPDDFLYFDVSADRPLTSDEWRDVIHFSERFALNDDDTLPQSAAEAVAAGFQKLSKGDSKYHQFDASLGEWDFGACLKFVREDGKEAVYLITGESGDQNIALTDPTATRLLKLADFPEIGPTFNYSLNAFDTENFITNLLDKAASASIAHYYFDMLPYYWWGNHPDQPEHTHTIVIDEGVPATCTTPGVSKGMYCEECGKVIQAQHDVMNLGHDFVDGVCTRCGETETTASEGSSGPAVENSDPVIID